MARESQTDLVMFSGILRESSDDSFQEKLGYRLIIKMFAHCRLNFICGKLLMRDNWRQGRGRRRRMEGSLTGLLTFLIANYFHGSVWSSQWCEKWFD